MRKTLGICLLALLLTGPAVAGEMPNDRPAPPPQQTSTVQEPTNAPDEPTVDGIIPNDAADSLTEIALGMLALLPSLL
ncbi:MAG TPA: hypothetical protein VF297_16020 [Pyrinomonadaceae bacterium]